MNSPCIHTTTCNDYFGNRVLREPKTVQHDVRGWLHLGLRAGA